MKFTRRFPLENFKMSIEVVPLVNVVFLLLIFFMLVFSWTSPNRISVRLPKTVVSDDIKEGSLVITITGEDVIYVEGKITTMRELRVILARPQNKSGSVLIKSDRRVFVGRLVEVWNLCRHLGIERINIATNK